MQLRSIRPHSGIYFSLILLAVTSDCMELPSGRASELNLNFIRGQDKHHVPAILQHGVSFPPGQYIVDVFLNNQKTSRQLLNITQAEVGELCLSADWIQQAHLQLELEQFKKQYNPDGKCYRIGSYPAASIHFDYGSQSLYISVPQVTLLASYKRERWDYGIPGLSLRYNTNASKTQQSRMVYYGSLDMNVRAGRWLLRGATAALSGQGIESPQLMVSTTFNSLRGILELGKSRMHSPMISDFGFYGISLYSDRSMRADLPAGYAPVISGVAHSNARITVSKGKNILTSRVLSPGAYVLKDIPVTGNGKLIVTVEEEDGSKTVRVYPVSVSPELLRSGDFDYYFALGERNDDSDVKGGFFAGNVNYGFPSFTLNLATILHRQYQGGGIELSRNMGRFGGLGIRVDASQGMVTGRRDVGDLHTGSVSRCSGTLTTIKYTKGIGEKSSLYLINQHYTSGNYVDFSGFSPLFSGMGERRKERYEATINRGDGRVFMAFSGWKQSYRNRSGNDSGASAVVSTRLGPASLSFSAGYTHTPWIPHDYNLSMSVSLPFIFSGKQQYTSVSMDYFPRIGPRTSMSVAGEPSDRLDWHVSAGTGQESSMASVSVGYARNAIQTGGSLTQSHYGHSGSKTAATLRASGMVLATRPGGIIFTRGQNDTVALVKIKGIPGVTFNGSSPTGQNGITALSLYPYTRNDIRINPDNIPDNVELLDSVYSVTPSRGAIVYREFSYTQVKRYVLKVIGRDGVPLPQGSMAVTHNGLDAGFVTKGGILLSNLLSSPEYLIVSTPAGIQCRVDMHRGVQNSGNGKMTEVHCE